MLRLGWALSASTLEAHPRRQVDCSGGGGTTRTPPLWLRSRSPCWHQGPAPPWVRSLANHDCFACACGCGYGCGLYMSMCVRVYITMYLHMLPTHTYRAYTHTYRDITTQPLQRAPACQAVVADRGWMGWDGGRGGILGVLGAECGQWGSESTAHDATVNRGACVPPGRVGFAAGCLTATALSW